MSETTATREHDFLAGFRELERELAQRDPAWLGQRRREGLEQFSRLGFPTTRDEAWRNTNVSPIAATSFRPPEAGAARGISLSGVAALDLGGPRIVLVNGRLSEELSALDPGVERVRVSGLARTLGSDPELLQAAWVPRDTASPSAFRSLNEGLSEDGAVVLVPDGVRLDRPIHVVHVSVPDAAGEASTATHPRTLVVLGRGSRAALVESFVGEDDAAYLTNSVTTLDIGEDASLDHCRIQLEAMGAYHIGHVDSHQAPNSRYAACHASFGARLARNEIRCVLGGPGATCALDGVYLTIRSQHLDNQTTVDHAEHHCDSREVFKGVLAGRSRGVFHGRIIVRPGAQGTDAKQSNPNLLLSGDALAQTRPQLEIYADDVKCTHGATIGRLDQDALFYLRSRAIGADEARALLVEAFLGEILDRLRIEPVRDFLAERVSARLAAV